jgi:hypothetical protein
MLVFLWQIFLGLLLTVLIVGLIIGITLLAVWGFKIVMMLMNSNAEDWN